MCFIKDLPVLNLPSYWLFTAHWWLLSCSSFPEWDGACCGWMRLGSLPQRDGKRGSFFSLSSAAAGGVGAVLCTADSSAGERTSLCSPVSKCVLTVSSHFPVWSTSFLRLINKVWQNIRVTCPSWACHTLVCFWPLFLRYCASVNPLQNVSCTNKTNIKTRINNINSVETFPTCHLENLVCKDGEAKCLKKILNL